MIRATNVSSSRQRVFFRRGKISFGDASKKQVIAGIGEDKRSTCSNLHAKLHPNKALKLHKHLTVPLLNRQTVCRSVNPAIIDVFSTINYKKREKVREKGRKRCWWLYLGPVVPSPESWLPASLGVPADLVVGDKGPGTDGQIQTDGLGAAPNVNKGKFF